MDASSAQAKQPLSALLLIWLCWMLPGHGSNSHRLHWTMVGCEFRAARQAPDVPNFQIPLLAAADSQTVLQIDGNGDTTFMSAQGLLATLQLQIPHLQIAL